MELHHISVTHIDYYWREKQVFGEWQNRNTLRGRKHVSISPTQYSQS
jgi:hypothetical protein